MRVYHFELAEHENYGITGWRLKSQPGFDPATGAGVAHDLLEHFADTTDEAHHEFMALGAFMYVRSLHYWYLNQWKNFDKDFGKGAGSDLKDVWDLVCQGTVPAIKDCPRVRCNDKQIHTYINRALAAFKKEWAYDAYNEYNEKPSKHTLTMMRRWMIRGYQRAKRRYRHVDQFDVALLFDRLSRRVDTLLNEAKRYQEDGFEPGLIVRLDLKNLTAEASLKMPRYW